MSQDQPTGLFANLPDDPAPLPPIDAALLASLPTYPTVQEIGWDTQAEAACRRLEKRGYVKVHRWKTDTINIRPTMHVGRLP
jgi:hypothetical protein